MLKNNKFLLLIASLWFLCTVISPGILNRAVDLSLAISFSAAYLYRQFNANSTQKMWLLRTRNFSLFAAGVFLIWEIFYIFAE